MPMADEATPLVLADGTKIDPTTGKPIKERSQYVEVPAATEAIRTITSVRRTLVDLPAPPKQMNAISVVLTYTLFGMTNTDIGIATGLSEQQVGQIKMLDAYATMQQQMIETILQQDAADINAIIKSKAHHAVQKIVDTMDEEGVLGFKAAQDLLDRAGHRPADIVEHRHKMEGGLRIEHITRDERETVPTIDITPEDI